MITAKQITNSMHKVKKLVLFCVAISFSCALCAQSGKTGNLTWELKDGVLTISGNGTMPNYEKCEAPWLKKDKHREQIKRVVINTGVTNIGTYAFFCCYNLISINIPNSITRIGANAFYKCSNLTSIIIPNSVNIIGKYAFDDCRNLFSVTIGNSVTSIEEAAFNNCSNLSSIDINSDNPTYSSKNGILYNKAQTRLIMCPKGQKEDKYIIPISVTKISDCAFCKNYNLTSITIPSDVADMGDAVFADCKKLKDIYVNWKTPLDISNKKDMFTYVPTSATLHVPAGTKHLYQNATGWKNFQNIVEQTTPTPKKEEKDFPEIDWILSTNSTTNKKELNINACIKSNTKVEQVSILVNEQSYRGITNAENNNNCALSVNQNVTLAEGKNIIKIQATNAAGTKEAERIVTYEPTQPPPVNKRYALIIGNAAYKNEPLKNAVNDATDMEAKLKQLGFTTVLITNANLEEMERAISNIAIKAKGYDAVMFYYAGHAIQQNGENYLIPVID